MTETKQVSITIGFQMDRKTLFALIACGALLIGGVLVAVTLGVGWASFTFPGAEVEAAYESSQMSVEGSNFEYTAEDIEDFKGVGLLKTGHPMLLTGTIITFVSLAAILASAFIHLGPTRMIATGLGVIGAILLMLAIILFPIGIDTFHDDFFTQLVGQPPELSWGAGLILGVIGTFLVLVGIVAAFMSLDLPKISFKSDVEQFLD